MKKTKKNSKKTGQVVASSPEERERLAAANRGNTLETTENALVTHGSGVTIPAQTVEVLPAEVPVSVVPARRAKSKRENVTREYAPDSEQNSDWEFQVKQEELVTSEGVKSGIHAVIRADTGAVIGQYSGQKAVQYSDIVSAFETGLQKIGLQFKREIFTTGNGARMFGEFQIGEKITIATEDFFQVLRLQSSHDGSLKPGFCFEGKRLACLNGAMISEKIMEIYKKHSEKFDLSYLSENIITAIETGQNYLAQTIGRMIDIQITDEQAKAILSNIVALGSLKGVSPRAGYIIHDNWKNPSDDEKGLGNSLYRLYNAATRFARDVEKSGRFELSRRANLFVTGAFDLAARNPANLQKLLAPPVSPLDFEGTKVK